MIDAALLEQRLADAEARLGSACDEIIELRELERHRRDEIALLKIECALAARVAKAYDDLAVENAFWKSAAERALRLWEAEAVKNENLLDAIEVVLGSSSTALSRENWSRLETLLDE